MKRKPDDDILKEARERFDLGYEADRDNRMADLEDRAFAAGEQYPSDVLEARKGRPCEVFNRLPQFIKQVTGEMRQNKPAIRVLPVDDVTDPELAKVYAAIIRHIESRSDGHRVYTRAGEHAVTGGIGWFRINADYADEGSFDQELKVELVNNPLAVVDDPDARGLLREDANWRFVTEMLTEEVFKSRYPKAVVQDFEGSRDDNTLSHWRTAKQVRVAEYWRRVPIKKMLAKVTGGAVHDMTDVEGVVPGAIIDLGDGKPVEVVAMRETAAWRVEWFLMTGQEILERGEWKGSLIPIIPVVGEEVVVGERVVRHGIVRHAKGPQRSYNYFRNASAEYAAVQPKVPFMATAKQVAPYKAMWDKLNTSNLPYLLYDIDPAAPSSRPERAMPPAGATSFHQEAQIADADMKAVTGIYDASLGQRSNETSGVAIRAREAQGDTVTFVYLDNLTAAIKMAGRMLVELIPHYYDGERVIRLLGEDDSVQGYVAVNRMLPDGRVFNDLSSGRYDVEVTTGPAFATKRQEAADRLLGLVQAVPGVAQVAGDIIAKSLDIPYGEDISDRLARMMPPGLDPKMDAKRQQEQQQNPGAAQAMQAQQQQQAMLEQAAMLELATKEAQARKATADAVKAEAEAQAAMQGQGQPQVDPATAALSEAVKQEQQIEAENARAEMQARVQLEIARVKAEADVLIAREQAQVQAMTAQRTEGESEPKQPEGPSPEVVAMQARLEALQGMMAEMARPKRKRVVTDAMGNIEAIEEE